MISAWGSMVGGAVLSAAPESITVRILTQIWVSLVLPRDGVQWGVTLFIPPLNC